MDADKWCEDDIIILVQKVYPQQLSHGSRYCSINNTNEQRLLISSTFLVEKKSTELPISRYTHEYERKEYRLKLVCFISSPQSLHHTKDWIASFYIALFKSSNYGNYVYLIDINLVECKKSANK